MSDENTFYTVGEVAERFSLTVRTLHHWEARGLLAPAELVDAHRDALSEYFPVSPAKHYLISRAYLCDESFRSHYDSQQEGFAQWLADAIEHVAVARGVDTDDPQWR